MKERIEQLDDGQAQHALLKFYKLLPEDIWQGSKPNEADLEYLREEIEATSNDEIAPFLKAVSDERQGDKARAETARVLLTEFARHDAMEEYVGKAVDDAEVPHMAAISTIIIAATIVLAAIPSEIERSEVTGKVTRIKLGHLAEAAKFVEAIGKTLSDLGGKLEFS